MRTIAMGSFPLILTLSCILVGCSPKEVKPATDAPSALSASVEITVFPCREHLRVFDLQGSLP